MQNTNCPKCGHAMTDDYACPACGQAARNGASRPERRDPPPEVANWVIEPVPPEVADHFRQTFDEAEYWAEVREVEKTGGVNVAELLAEVERIAHGKD